MYEGDSQGYNLPGDGMYGDVEPGEDEQAPDMYGAGYQMMGKPQELVDAEDEYAGIDIDLTKIQKVETKKDDKSEEQSIHSSKKSEEESDDKSIHASKKSEKESSEGKKSHAKASENGEDSEADVNRARFEDNEESEEPPTFCRRKSKIQRGYAERP